MIQREKEAIERTRRAVAERLQRDTLDTLAARARDAAGTRSLSEALSADSLGLIVEPKRATAARGVLNQSLDLAAVARECEQAGAIALSIVTEPLLSDGRVDDLTTARQACELPLLARDFIVHASQLYELRAAGADAVVVPVAAFRDEDLQQEASLPVIVETAYRLGMDVVLSVRDADELELALQADADIVNIDNRDDDGAIDVERTFDLLADVPAGKAVISESVAQSEEVARLHRAGVDALLLDEGHVETDLHRALQVFHDLTLDQQMEQ